uniref:matrixin family metalloprotease n=1 Tax=Flavobacterium sp. TaxID=239 RepID=UPI004049468B
MFKKQFYFWMMLAFASCQPKINTKTVVGIQSYEGFPQAKTDTIAQTIAAFYQVKTVVLPVMKLPKSAFTNYKAPRYRADSLIKIQNNNVVEGIDYVFGLTHQDICITKYEKDGQVKKPIHKYTDFGIMGLAYRPGKSCVVSTFRLQHANEKIHFSRLKKVSVHEFGHNLGLPHCPDKKCVMTDAVESVSTIDNANLDLCAACKQKLL